MGDGFIKKGIGYLLQLLLILLGITFLSFAMIRVAGSDAVTEKYSNMGMAVSQEVIDAEKERLGLDRPFLSQYFLWLKNALKGDLGISFISGKSVYDLLISKLPATLMLTVCSLLLTLLISLPAGIFSALNSNRIPDYVIRILSFVGNSLPLFLTAFILIHLFCIKLELLPVVSLKTDPLGIILPACSLAFVMSAKYTRQIRASVMEELSKDYVTGARARGIPERVIISNSVLRVSMLTILTLLALSVGSLLGGTAVVESIFMWDGIGKLAVDSIKMRDYPVIQAYVVWMALIYVIVNLMTDILYRFLDPRIRAGESRP